MTVSTRKVIRLEDVPLEELSAEKWRAWGIHSRDQGRAKELISRTVCGSTDLNLGVYWMNPGEVHPLHLHTAAAEFYYVFSGRAQITVDDEVVEAVPGTAIYLPVNTKHKIVVDGPEELCVLYGYNVPHYPDTGTVWLE